MSIVHIAGNRPMAAFSAKQTGEWAAEPKFLQSSVIKGEPTGSTG